MILIANVRLCEALQNSMFEYTDAEGEYESFLSPSNFQLAWRRVRNSTTRQTMDRLGLRVFSAQTDGILSIISHQVQQGTFAPQPPEWLYFPKQDSSTRPYPLLPIEERIVYQAIGNILVHNSYGDLAKCANDSVFAHIPTPTKEDGAYKDFMFLRNFSDDFSPTQYTKFLNTVSSDLHRFSKQENIWVIETDIRSFYPSINHTMLLETLEQRGWLKSQETLMLLQMCLKEWSKSSDNIYEGVGIPIGYGTSDLLATLFLLDLDREIPFGILSSRRFVDDMYYFVDGRKQSNDLLSKLKKLCRSRGLELNDEKTKRFKCTPDTVKKHISEMRSNRRISFSDTREDAEYSDLQQAKLIELFKERYSGPSDCSAEQIEQFTQHASEFAFILNRLTSKDDWIKENALCMLDEVPYLSYASTNYLRLFCDDNVIVETLLASAANSYQLAEKRVNCIRTLAEIGFPLDSLVQIVREWFCEDDFHLHHAGIEILSGKYNDLGFWMELSSSSTSAHIRAHAFAEATRLVFEDEDKFISVVNKMLSDSSLAVRLMGIFFRRRQLLIPASRFDFDPLSPELLELFFTLDEKEENQNFFSSFAMLFGFELSSQLGLERKLSNVKQTTQFLVNTNDADTDVGVFFISLKEVVHHLLVAISRKRYPQHEDFSFWGVALKLHEHHENAFNALSILYALCEKINEGRKLDTPFSEQNKLIQRVKNVIAFDIYLLYTDSGLLLPFSLDLYIQNWYPEKANMSNKVFISYSHNDMAWLTKLRRHLTPLVVAQNLDIWYDTKIKPGDQWLSEIKKALSQAKVVIMLVSPAFLASNFIREHEFLPTLQEAKTGGKIILWVLLSDCLWQETQIADFQAAHDSAIPLDMLPRPRQNIVLSEICRIIKQAAV